MLPAWCVVLALGDVLGVAAAASSRGASPGWGWTAASLLALAGLMVAGLSRRARTGWLVAALVFTAGFALGFEARRPPDLAPPVRAAVERGTPVALVAEVTEPPVTARRGQRVRAVLLRVAGAPASGVVDLLVLDSPRPFDALPGDRITTVARLREPSGPADPGLPDPDLAGRIAGVDVAAAVPSSKVRLESAKASAGGPMRAIGKLRRRLVGRVEAGGVDDASALLRTAVLGDRAGVSEEVERGFRAAGATHALSVSGLHLGAVAALAFLLLRFAVLRMPALAVRVEAGALAAALALPGVWLYTLLTGAAVATLRAAWMASLVLAARMLGRRPSAGHTLAGAALVMIAASPLCLFDLSFQLSFLSVAALALAASSEPPATGWRGRARRWLVASLLATAVATLATGPLVVHAFGEIASAAPLGNLIVVPLVELALVPVGLAGAALGLAFEAPGDALLVLSRGLAQATLAVVRVFGAWAPVWTLPRPDALQTWLLVAAGFALLVAWRRCRPRSPERRRWHLGATLAAAALLASVGVRYASGRLDDSLRVTFLDVGQGDAILVRAPGGAVALVDGGGDLDGSFDPGAQIVTPALASLGIRRIDLMVLSHPHPDHLRGLVAVLQRFEVGTLWTSGDDGKNPEYAALLNLARARGVSIERPAATHLGPVLVTPTGPWLGDLIGPPPGVSVNDASLSVRLSYAGRAVLLAGDLEAQGEAELAGRAALGLPVRADVLKVPHHGSRTSSTRELLDAVAPRIAVALLGRANRFGFPAASVVGRYEGRGVRLLRTDRDGAVEVRIGSDGRIGATCARGCR